MSSVDTTYQEIELKLQLRPEDVKSLAVSKTLAGVKGRPTTRTLESTYFDTEDLALHSRGLTLRVRKVNGRHVQTLKAAPDGVGGVTVRGEWEAPVEGDRPDLAAIADPLLQAELAPLVAAGLRPVFETHIRRTVRTLQPADGTEIELAIDQGEIRSTHGRVMPVNEVELELKRGGDRVALYDFALKLNEDLPLRVELRSKAERGYALALDEDRPRWSKAGRLDLGPTDTVETALARIVRHCIGHLVANEASALAGEEPEGVHQMRVALRRLRSALSTFKGFLPPEQAEVLTREVKWLAGAFGAARDWDVFLTQLLPPVTTAFAGNAEVQGLHAAAAECRVQGYADARAAILSPRYTALLLKLGAWVDGRGWRAQPVSERSALLFQPVTALADSLLSKRHRQARRRGRQFAALPPDARHELRISLKKLRYAVEFFRGLYPAKAVKRYLDELSALQDVLGHLQDVATIAKLVGQVQTVLAEKAPEGWQQGAGIVLGWHARGLGDAEPRLVKDWESFADAKPFWSEPTATG